MRDWNDSHDWTGPRQSHALALRLDLPARGDFAAATWHGADRPVERPVAAEALLLDPQALRRRIDEGFLETNEPLEIGVLDPDGGLARRRAAVGLDGTVATLWLWVRCDEGASPAPSGDDVLALPLVTAVLDGDGLWREADRVLILTLPDPAAVFRDRPALARAAPEDFPRLPPESAGRPLPRVYGRPHRSTPLLVGAGAETELARGAVAGDLELIVRDASAFEAGVEMWLCVESEELFGRFDGNRFVVAQRGRVHAAGRLARAMVQPTLAVLEGVDFSRDYEHVGASLRINGQTRRIVGTVAESRTVLIDEAFENALGGPALFGSGVAAEIVAPPADHPAGTTVFAKDGDWVYLLADHPVAEVGEVEGLAPVEPTQRHDGLALWQGRQGPLALPPALYRVNRSDTESFPALQRPVATLRLHLPPRLLGYADDSLRVAVVGAPRGDANRLLPDPLPAGTHPEAQDALANPVEVIRDLLLAGGGLDPAAFDDAAWRSAAAARADEAFAFCLRREADLAAVVFDLARQARLSLRWREGKLSARALDAAFGEPPAAGGTPPFFDASALARAGLEWEQSPAGEVLAGIVARYVRRGRDEAVVVSDPEASRRHGPRTLLWDMWAYQSKALVARSAAWWLRRRRHRYDRLRVETFLAGARLEPGDALAVDGPALRFAFAGVSELPEGPWPGRVLSLNHRPGAPAPAPSPAAGAGGGDDADDNAPVGRIDRVVIDMELPRWAGCRASCETACESSACEQSGCELVCVTTAETVCQSACETRCEAACEISCTAACESVCQTDCMTDVQGGRPCRSSVENGCGGSCEADCEEGCEAGCELSCQVGCEVGCQVCCENRCEASHREGARPVRRARVVQAPSAAGGWVGVVEIGAGENAPCPSFLARDRFDRAPGEGELVTVYLDGNEEWIVLPGRRDAKIVKVLSVDGGECTVVERDRAGNSWGDEFTAWTVDD